MTPCLVTQPLVERLPLGDVIFDMTNIIKKEKMNDGYFLAPAPERNAY